MEIFCNNCGKFTIPEHKLIKGEIYILGKCSECGCNYATEDS